MKLLKYKVEKSRIKLQKAHKKLMGSLLQFQTYTTSNIIKHHLNLTSLITINTPSLLETDHKSYHKNVKSIEESRRKLQDRITGKKIVSIMTDLRKNELRYNLYKRRYENKLEQLRAIDNDIKITYKRD